MKWVKRAAVQIYINSLSHHQQNSHVIALKKQIQL